MANKIITMAEAMDRNSAAVLRAHVASCPYSPEMDKMWLDVADRLVSRWEPKLDEAIPEFAERV